MLIEVHGAIYGITRPQWVELRFHNIQPDPVLWQTTVYEIVFVVCVKNELADVVS